MPVSRSDHLMTKSNEFEQGTGKCTGQVQPDIFFREFS